MKKFEHPLIFGLIGKKFKRGGALEKRFNVFFKKIGLPAICLQFKVEERYFKRLLTCMKLMDIFGVYIFSRYKGNKFNFYIKEGKSFKGYKSVGFLTRQK